MHAETAVGLHEFGCWSGRDLRGCALCAQEKPKKAAAEEERGPLPGRLQREPSVSPPNLLLGQFSTCTRQITSNLLEAIDLFVTLLVEGAQMALPGQSRVVYRC